jgi:hypothetical protein
MTYTCKDCSHTSNKKFPNGKCPACDSYNISSTNKLAESTTKEKKPKKKIEIVILVLLWGLIAYGAWDKYYRHDDQTKLKTAPTASKIQDPELDF